MAFDMPVATRARTSPAPRALPACAARPRRCNALEPEIAHQALERRIERDLADDHRACIGKALAHGGHGAQELFDAFAHAQTRDDTDHEAIWLRPSRAL
jgi:hypothetical protein